ncbi:hypothetical protein [Streptomyces sp. V4I2]|uniref:hypothetical protein n=1 Tax=Streptomyces sp. V4I2 TaxID=3042280 RepID=UPI0027834CA6|nr:hypothetical protein [Streptomyces sp. V4I2]MDQ1051594.1 hypothetical protein [Streptomyces sp. V4I2]
MTGSDGDGDGRVAHDPAVLETIEAVRAGGTLGRAQRRMASESGGPRAGAAELQKITELHVCMGLNACKGHDRDGAAPMAGMGRCATVLHVCHGANECRGQGGCGYTGPDAELARPGTQACRENGSCASPINVSRVFAGGPLKGKSVWKLARQLFEARMYEAGIPFGPAPGEGYPDDLVPPYEVTEQDKQKRRLQDGAARQSAAVTSGPDGAAS